MRPQCIFLLLFKVNTTFQLKCELIDEKMVRENNKKIKRKKSLSQFVGDYYLDLKQIIDM